MPGFTVLHPELTPIIIHLDATLVATTLVRELKIRVDHLPARQVAPILLVIPAAVDVQPARLVAHAGFLPAVDARWKGGVSLACT